MCGRFEIHSAIGIIARYVQIDSVTTIVDPNYNIALSQKKAVVVGEAPGPRH